MERSSPVNKDLVMIAAGDIERYPEVEVYWLGGWQRVPRILAVAPGPPKRPLRESLNNPLLAAASSTET
jgi:hypothetical protein